MEVFFCNNIYTVKTKTMKVIYELVNSLYCKIICGTMENIFYIPSGCDTTEGFDLYDDFISFNVDTTEENVILHWIFQSNMWIKNIYLIVHNEYAEYYYNIYGNHNIDVLHYFEGINKEKYSNHIDVLMHFNDHKETHYSDLRVGSKACFKYLFNPEPNTYAKNMFYYYEYSQISAHSDLDYCGGNYSYNPGILSFVISDDKQSWMTLGLGVMPGEYFFSEYEYNGGIEFGLNLNYWGEKKVEGSFVSPSIILAVGCSPESALKKYINVLAEKGLIKKNVKKAALWWKYPRICGWGEQCYMGDLFQVRSAKERTPDTRVYDSCNQRNYEYFLEILDKHDIPWKTIVIDSRWTSIGGLKKVDEGKWHDLRGFVDKLHCRGKKVLLWVAPWDTDGIDDSLCIFFNEKKFKAKKNRDGRFKKFGSLKHCQKICPDPTLDKYKDIVVEWLGVLLDNKEGCLDCDGIKMDYISATPGLYGLDFNEGSKRLYGIELLKYYQTFIYNEAKKIKEDALIMGQSCNPYFVECTDVIRIGDIYSPYKKVMELVKYRVDMCKVVDEKWDIEIDSWPIPSLEELMNLLEYQVEEKSPSLYYITHIDLTNEAFEIKHYERIKELWNKYLLTFKNEN